MTAAPLPDWVMPPPEGFTAEDLDRLADLPPHTELIDGSLVFVSPQASFHSVIHAGADIPPESTALHASDVMLAVEVVAPDSEERDRERKPELYAKAGLPHFWRVENCSGRPTVYVYELDPATHAYALTGIHHDRLKVTVPFDIEIDLTEIDRL